MKKLSVIATILLVLSTMGGCASMTGVGLITESVSTFDSSKTIECGPAHLHDESRGIFDPIPFRLGARWNSAQPDMVALIVSYHPTIGSTKSFTNIQGIDININGKITSHEASGTTTHDRSDYNAVSKTIYTSSKNNVVIPLAMLEQMTTATDTRIRIRSMDGYLDAHFSVEKIPGAADTAIVFLREFLATIRQQKPL
jgi:hypothetical protein